MKLWEPLAAAIFILISLLLFPLTLLGYVLWLGGAILSRRRSGVSGTAQGPLSARWFAHILGTRRDEASFKLLQALPGVPPLGLGLVSGPRLLAQRLSGYTPKAFRYPFQGEVRLEVESSARMSFFDAIVERCLPEVAQLVILGAGFDTRCYRLPPRSPVRCFELDAPKTQAQKRSMLAKAGIDARAVTFVSADFEREDWLAQLEQAGFDPARRSLIIWEGVIVYLEQAAVESTLRKIASLAPGTRVAFDYFTSQVLTSQALYLHYARLTSQAAGEPFKFGLDSTPPSRQRLEELLASCGLSLEDQRTLGRESNGRRAWGGFALAVVPSQAPSN